MNKKNEYIGCACFHQFPSLLHETPPAEAIKHTQAPQLILVDARYRQDHDPTSKDSIFGRKECIDPSYILALTFSKESARKMCEKVEKLLQGKYLILKTFHSFCAELIKSPADKCRAIRLCGILITSSN